MTPSTKKKLLDTAIEMFWLESYSSVSVQHICNKADVNKGSFYHFFPSKIDLALEAFQQLWNMLSGPLDKAFLSSFSPQERIHNYTNFIYEVQKEQREKTGKVLGCPYASCGGEMSTQDERIRLKIKEIFASYSDYFKKTLIDANIKDVATCSQLAGMMLSYSTGVIFRAKIHNDIEIIRHDMEEGLLLFLPLL